MAKKKVAKKEALTTRLFITEILEKELGIPSKNIVNDTTFNEYTGSKRPDLLISTIEYDTKNDKDYISNLVAYAEAKDDCILGDKDWEDAVKQGLEKAPQLRMPYFIVTNLKISYYFNTITGKELTLNGNPLREFLNLDLLKYIKAFLNKNPKETNITVNADTSSIISEDIFNKKLWELANIYREISFKDSSDKIDFSIGFIVLKYFEEKTITLKEPLNPNMQYWSGLRNTLDTIDKVQNQLQAKTKFINELVTEFEALKKDAHFKEMSQIIDTVLTIVKAEKDGLYVNYEHIVDIFKVIDNMGTLHASGFDLFGSIYEKFASNEEKKAFGEFFTRRHYTHIFTKLLFKKKLADISPDTTWKILDLACGTGGFLTEAFKIILREIQQKYHTNNPMSLEGREIIATRDKLINKLKKEFIHGFDVKHENIARAKLNMFLVGDGHTNIVRKNSLKDLKVYEYRDIINEKGKPEKERYSVLKEDEKFDFIITNPPYGSGTEIAETTSINTSRFELAFIVKIINLMKIGGEGCLIIPDGFFENPSYAKLRKEVLEKCIIKAIVSLPKHAFAPYTMEKTYALYIQKKRIVDTTIKQEPIWMYVIDNDGFANSNKRFPTRLRDENGKWLHDEISSYLSSNSEEEVGILEQRWLKYDDKEILSEYINEKGEVKKIRKAGFIEVNKDNGVNEENYWNLLPEYYLRPFEPHYITLDDFEKEVNKLLENI